MAKIIKEQQAQSYVKFGLEEITPDAKRRKISKLFNFTRVCPSSRKTP